MNPVKTMDNLWLGNEVLVVDDADAGLQIRACGEVFKVGQADEEALVKWLIQKYGLGPQSQKRIIQIMTFHEGRLIGLGSDGVVYKCVQGLWEVYVWGI